MKVDVIAEIGINHGGSMEKARDMIRLAKMSGADVAKFQLYKPEEILGKDSPYLEDATRAQFTLEQHHELKAFCDQLDIEYCCSLFHAEHVAWAESIGMKRYKVASRSIKDRELLAEINKTGKRVWVSLGHIESIEDKYTDEKRRTITSALTRLIDCDTTLLYCVPKYPSSIDDIKLTKMDDIAALYGRCGFSSHCPDTLPSLAAVARGARAVEHHVCISRDEAGCDISSSVTFAQLKILVSQIRTIERVL